MTSPHPLYISCHMPSIIGLFSCFAKCVSVKMSSSSSSPRRRRHKKKHRHHRRDSDKDFASLLQQLRDEIASNHNSIRSEMQSISARVDKIEGEARVQTNTPPEQSLQTNPVAQEVPGEQSSTTGTTHQLVTDVGPERVDPLPSTGDKDNNAWADRDDPPEYEETIFWQPDADSDASEGETTRLSATTTKIVEDAFSRSMPNEKRHSIKRKQPVPDTPYTKCPKLDSTILSRLPRPAKDADRASARIQTLVLDAACPLINMLESARKGTLNTKEAAESAQQALKLLGNASANISRERRQKATQHLNPELATLVDDEESFKDAAPMLFGKTFDQRAKDHIDAIRSLKKTSSLPRGQSFQRGHPPMSRGGGNSRGRGTFKKPGNFQTKRKTQ